MGRDDDDGMTLIFRCPPELIGLLPPPIPAVQGLPDWFKALPHSAFNAVTQAESQTVKRCPPFIDAMTYGFLIPLPCDVTVENGEFSWTFEVPTNNVDNFLRSPIAFHDPSQVAGTPFHDADRFAIKFNNFWSIEAPPGHSILFTHPVNRADLPFTTLTGLVDADLYHDSRVNFPAHWHDLDFNGVLPKGTPIAQCLPVKRERWQARVEALSEEAAARVRAMAAAIDAEEGVYRRQFRAGKR
ncbi:MAG TPA: hypothetical protein VFB31_00245 [Pseudolabrys sp.]|nr:hypothetical protein [Pseudolabrys sp.]